ncbi:MAG TPA: ATP-dependent DNA helicase, partial [Candidatus Altiarchaeales archaeon]|nr:ATP-dependent DNA helicase [Candidatus Altiarchaeales archaeon]
MSIFPFERVRKGQKEFLKDSQKAIESGKHLLAHAPTGIGKTAAVISPALEFAIKNGKTLFFLTPKHTQHVIVIDTLKKIRNRHGGNFVVVDIVGKQWTCPYKVRDLDSREFNEFCRAMKRDERCKYYNNAHRRKSKILKGVIEELKGNILHSEEVMELCSKNKLCPYEISVRVGRSAIVFVCDYFHIFSPKVRQAFLAKLNKDLENSILIIDEAHNLPDRVRKLLSNNLSEISLMRAAKEASFLGHENLDDDFREIIKILKKLGNGMKQGDERKVKREKFIDAIVEKVGMEYKEFYDLVNDLGEEVLSIPNRHRSYAKSVYRFLESWGGENLGYARILNRKKIFRLSYTCLDPSISSKEIFDSCHSSILMSGTLVPLDMYCNILDMNPDRTILKEYKSPFPRENRLNLIISGVTTRYKHRSEFMYKKYADIIQNIVRRIPGNIAIFFPSYEFIDSVSNFLRSIEKNILIERRDMKKEEKIELYRKLASRTGNNGAILLGVQAGSLSEGIDYANNLLDSVIVVGLPLETPNLEVKSLIDYYDFKFERGWDYGYIYPAMNRALQAAGRCIRSETDKGIIVLMDERFKWKNYSKCFPTDMEFIVTELPEKYIEKFFS